MHGALADAKTEPPTDLPQGGHARWGQYRRVALALGVAVASVFGIGAAYVRAPTMIAFVKTDNAYVKGDVTFVSSKVSGYVTKVLTENDRSVETGQPLVQIDPTDYSAAVADAEAMVAQQQAAVSQIEAQQRLQGAQIRTAQAGEIAADATFGKTRADYVRTNALIAQGAVSLQLLEATRAENIRARSSVSQSRAQVDLARTQLEVLSANHQAASAQLKGAQARLLRAKADLVRTVVLSPREGRVAARNVRLGEFVNSGTRLLAVTPTEGLWVEANLRETQLGRVRPGDRVEVSVDAIPGVQFCGTLEGYQGASGSEFAVIAPDNATGNFTKIVRRFTVRIVLDEGQPEAERLAVGMSVIPTIAVGSASDGKAHGGLLSWFVAGTFECEARP
jgi:membrane fusion protein (multidrug efflux system)